MSNRSRLIRFLKSLTPNFGNSNTLSHPKPGRSARPEREIYDWDDARAALNELGMHMKPDQLAYLLSKNTILDDFALRLQKMEKNLGKKLLSRESVILEDFQPSARMVDEYLRISIQVKGQERVLAEYEMP